MSYNIEVMKGFICHVTDNNKCDFKREDIKVKSNFDDYDI